MRLELGLGQYQKLQSNTKSQDLITIKYNKPILFTLETFINVLLNPKIPTQHFNIKIFCNLLILNVYLINSK